MKSFVPEKEGRWPLKLTIILILLGSLTIWAVVDGQRKGLWGQLQLPTTHLID